jgi:hypothetical protein
LSHTTGFIFWLPVRTGESPGHQRHGPNGLSGGHPGQLFIGNSPPGKAAAVLPPAPTLAIPSPPNIIKPVVNPTNARRKVWVVSMWSPSVIPTLALAGNAKRRSDMKCNLSLPGTKSLGFYPSFRFAVLTPAPIESQNGDQSLLMQMRGELRKHR